MPTSSNPWDCQGVLVRDIEDKEFHVNVGSYGRISNNLTSLKREIRPALRLGKESLQHVDIRCCQPGLIGKIVKGRTRQQDREQGRETGGSNYDVQFCQCLYSSSTKDSPGNCTDLDTYCELTQSGEFYDFMLAKMKNLPCLSFTRDDLKKRVLADVIAKRKANVHGDEYPSDVEDTFRALFPSVYRFIRDVNADGWQHANLIRLLQQEESKLVIETVAADLVVRKPQVFLLTLHDALFTTSSGIPFVVEAFERAFSRTGYPMSLKVA